MDAKQLVILGVWPRMGAVQGWTRSRKSVHATWYGFPPGPKHWYGAAPSTAMSHVATRDSLTGSSVT